MDFLGGVETAYRLSEGYVRGPQGMGKHSDTLIISMTLYYPSSLWEMQNVTSGSMCDTRDKKYGETCKL